MDEIKKHNKKIKLAARYIVVAYFMYLGWYITRPEWVIAIRDDSGIAMGIVYGAVFGALTLVYKSHLETAPVDD